MGEKKAVKSEGALKPEMDERTKDITKIEDMSSDQPKDFKTTNQIIKNDLEVDSSEHIIPIIDKTTSPKEDIEDLSEETENIMIKSDGTNKSMTEETLKDTEMNMVTKELTIV